MAVLSMTEKLLTEFNQSGVYQRNHNEYFQHCNKSYRYHRWYHWLRNSILYGLRVDIQRYWVKPMDCLSTWSTFYTVANGINTLGSN